MSLAVVDVREWQNVLDLKTGKKSSADTPAVNLVKKVLKNHPYPGDLDGRGNRWVTETALDLLDCYDPQFVFVSYAQQYFSLRFTALSETERQRAFNAVFAEVERFKRETGFLTFVVGTGAMTPVVGYIDLSRLDGLAVSANWSTRYAGLYQVSDRDLAYVNNAPGVERVVTREEYLALCGGTREEAGRLPDYLVVAGEGFCFKSPSLRRPVMIPAANKFIPVSATLGEVKSIIDISRHIQACLRNGKVALVLVEGAGIKDFQIPYKKCTNGLGWYYYETGDAQYLAISKGEHQFFTFPGGYKSYVEDDENKEYPFSGYFTAIPTDTLGCRFAGRSIAVGNRSMFMHTTTGVDIALECFARNLYNQGCLAVIHREDK